MPDGRPDLSAPAPKGADGKPDLSGIWAAANINNPDLAGDGVTAPLQPWAAALYNERRENLGKDRPSGRCLPHGVTDYDGLGFNWKLLQTPETIAILYEGYNHYRQILMDGRPLPKPTGARVSGLLRGPLGRRYTGGRHDRLQ